MSYSPLLSVTLLLPWRKIRKCTSRRAEWHKFQLRSSFQWEVTNAETNWDLYNPTQKVRHYLGALSCLGLPFTTFLSLDIVSSSSSSTFLNGLGTQTHTHTHTHTHVCDLHCVTHVIINTSIIQQQESVQTHALHQHLEVCDEGVDLLLKVRGHILHLQNGKGK